MHIHAQPLRRLVANIFERAGCRPPENERIAHYLVQSNLVGHDSHGIIRVPAYLRFLQQDMVRANQQLRVVWQNESIAITDGQFGFGQVMGERAMDLGIAMARKQGVAVVALRNSGHLGRIGDWPTQCAEAGMVSFHWVNTNGFGLLVAPFGGIDRRLSANPIAAGAPVSSGPPIILDISTCSIAEGKIRVAKNRGVTVPEGMIIDAQGCPTQDPEVFYASPPGAILPFGGHKGYGLGVLCEILAGALTGGGCSNADNNNRMLNNMLSIILDPERFVGQAVFAEELQRYIGFVKSSRLVTPDGKILMPGEIEEQTKQQRLAEGIEIDATTWQALCDAACTLGIAPAEIDSLLAESR